MNCRSVEKWVWQEGAGNLPAAAVEHASACSDCRALIDQVRLLDRSIGATIVPDPSEAYWDSMAQRVAQRLANPSDRVIVLVPAIPMWKRFVSHAWAPTMAVVLLAVIASQRTLVAPSRQAFDIATVEQKAAALSAQKPTIAPESDELAQSDSRSNQELAATVPDQSQPVTQSLAESATAMRAKPTELPQYESAKSSVAPPVSTMPESKPALAFREESVGKDRDQVWPDRQVTIMGLIDSNSPNKPSADDRRLAAQDPFGSYERQMASAENGMESAGTSTSPGRLMDGPTGVSQSRGSERLTPAEQMRRFDEIAELHELIARLEHVPVSSRAMSQWAQWSTAWFRLGMLADQVAVIDSALTSVSFFQSTVPIDSVTAAEWQGRRLQLENRRTLLQQ